MDNGSLNFNYQLMDGEDVENEIKIKQKMRNIAYNKNIVRDIPRYSDMYVESVPFEEICQSINTELLGPELMRIYGNKEIPRTEMGHEITDEIEEKDEIIEQESLESNGEYNLVGSDDTLEDEPANQDENNVY